MKETNESSVEKHSTNKQRVICTRDGKKFEVAHALLVKYSLFFRHIIDDEKSEDQPIKITQVDSSAFEIINEFFELHKDNEPTKIHLPLKKNQNLKQVMEEGDALLVKKIVDKGEEFLSQILEACRFLQVEEFEKRLVAAGVFPIASKNTVEEMKSMYPKFQNSNFDEELREQVRQRLHHIAEIRQNS